MDKRKVWQRWVLIPTNDDAFSPTFTTILTVMTTLTALMFGGIIGIYAFEMMGSIHAPRLIVTSVVQSGPDILVMYEGGDTRLPALYSLAVVGPDGQSYFTVSPGGELSKNGTPVAPDAGSVMVLPGAATPDPDHVEVIAYFADGSNQVVADTYV
jgi:hypothetical protein